MFLDWQLSTNYNSPSQKIRIVTEKWVGDEIFCPSCGNKLKKYKNNLPVADFYCSICSEDFELKSKEGKFANKIVNGAYQTMMDRLVSNQNPHLFLLGYKAESYVITDFFVIPKYFFVPEIIEQRKPLASTARRAGWVGCNISLKNLPLSGRIFYIKNKIVSPKASVLNKWRKTSFLKSQSPITDRSWIIDIMNCLDKLGKTEFSLSDIYFFEKELQQKHPQNLHVKDKIRQQLQILRNKGYLEFIE